MLNYQGAISLKDANNMPLDELFERQKIANDLYKQEE